MSTPTNKAVQRLSAVQQQLKPASSTSPPSTPTLPLDHSTRFRPALPADLPVNYTPLNPLSYLLKAAQIRPHHPAIVYPTPRAASGGELSWTYSEWALRVKDLAYALLSSGLKEGDRVFVLGPNVPWTAGALQAIPAAKGILVTVNTRLSAAEIEYIYDHSKPKVVLVDRELAHLLPPEARGGKGGVRVVECGDSYDEEDPYEKFLMEGREADKKRGGKGWGGLEMQRDENATWAISYTSGTTSRPKGVETSYRGTYLAAIANAVESRLNDSSRYLWTLPMFHCLGWCFPYACTMMMCTQVCLRSVDIDEVWRGFLERGVTHYCAAPTVQISIANHPKARKLDKPVLATIAGAAPTATLIEQLESLGIGVVHVYGLTESYGPSTRTYYVNPNSPDYYRDMARQGFSFLTADDIRIFRQHDTSPSSSSTTDGAAPHLVEVTPNGQEVGELCFRGNIVMKGYYRNPEATKEAFEGGWFHTGDLGVRFPDGTFAIADRAKDIIISGGENCSSLAVESALASHPDVLECAVVARPHSKWGERPHAFVVLKPSSSSASLPVDQFAVELKAHTRQTLSGFAVPEWIEVVPADDLPKTSTGKVQKVALRERVKKLPPV